LASPSVLRAGATTQKKRNYQHTESDVMGMMRPPKPLQCDWL
jgi:hypothetical protein